MQRNKWQQQELIAELRRRQAKEHRPVYEGKDGTIEDIITGTAPPTAPPPTPPLHNQGADGLSVPPTTPTP